MSDFDPRTAVAPFARAEVSRWRRWWLVLGALLLVLGLLGAAIVLAAASPRDQAALLIAIFVLVAILPGAAMLAYGVSLPTQHPLVRALEREPQRLHSISCSYMRDIEGDYVDVARVELENGSSYVFAVPKQLAQDLSHDREPQLKRERT